MVEDAVVIAVEVAPGEGVLAGEPVTRATLRDSHGEDHVVRIVGGPTGDGGRTYVAGFVIPALGARVPLDLRERSVLYAWTPNTPAGTWAPAALPIPFVMALPQSRDLGGAMLAELEVAARTWSRPACTAFRARAVEERALAPGDDGVNGVFVHDTTWPAELVPGALGQTVVHLDGQGKVHDTDVHLNGVDFRFSTNGAPGTQDARSVLVHELGHALGLGHATDPRATMYASGSGLRWRSLEQDDVDGVCALYPGSGAAGCDVDPCPTGFVCVAGACQRPGDRSDVCAPCAPELGACEAAGDGARCVDLGAGRVCGRACAGDRDCGAGFACRATTEAGDLQCVSLRECTNGANLCQTDAECTRPAVCRAGACVGSRAMAPDAGAADAGAPDGGDAPTASGSGCDCRASPEPSSSMLGALAALAFAVSVYTRRR